MPARLSPNFNALLIIFGHEASAGDHALTNGGLPMLACKLKTLTAAGAVGLLLAVGSTGASAQSAYCDGVAQDYASQHAHGGDVVGGAIGGAVTGAIIGGIVGGRRGAGTGAAIGGGVGAVGGAANQSQRWQSLYHHAYNDCMARGAPRQRRSTAARCKPTARSRGPTNGTTIATRSTARSIRRPACSWPIPANTSSAAKPRRALRARGHLSSPFSPSGRLASREPDGI
jgi:hypothetical protein